jgi:hypothetical protein
VSRAGKALTLIAGDDDVATEQELALRRCLRLKATTGVRRDRVEPRARG